MTTPAYDYRSEVLRNVNPEFREKEKDVIALAAMGIAGEAGECADLAKKHLFHGVEFDREKMIKELGDVRWYLELMAFACGVSMEEVERRNVEKLRKRYPNGFTTEASIKRADLEEGQPKCIGLDKAHVDGNCPAHSCSYLRAEVPGTGKTMDELRREDVNCEGCGWDINAGHAAGCPNMPKESTSGAV